MLYPSNLALGIGGCPAHAPGAAGIEILIKALGQSERGLQIISAALKSCGNLAALKPWGSKTKPSNDLRETLMTQQAASLLPRGPMIMRSVENSQNQAREHVWAYSYTAGRFNCWKSMNLCLLKSLWAWGFVCIWMYSDALVWGYACKSVLSCEHCAFIIFNAIPESQWKAANEAHWLSGL